MIVSYTMENKLFPFYGCKSDITSVLLLIIEIRI